MISHYQDTVLCSGQIGAPFFKGGNDSSKVLVIYWIINFGCRAFAGSVKHWVHYVGVIDLG